jgi:hypothetical protein
MAVVEFGLNPKDFWRLEIKDFFILYRQHIRREERFGILIKESCRLAGWMPASMLGDGKKKIKPTDFIRFPHEESHRRSNRNKPYSREEKENFLKAVKPEWIVMIDN